MTKSALLALLFATQAHADPEAYRMLLNCSATNASLAPGVVLKFDLYGGLRAGKGFVVVDDAPTLRTLHETHIAASGDGDAPTLTGPIQFDFADGHVDYTVELGAGSNKDRRLPRGFELHQGR